MMPLTSRTSFTVTLGSLDEIDIDDLARRRIGFGARLQLHAIEAADLEGAGFVARRLARLHRATSVGRRHRRGSSRTGTALPVSSTTVPASVPPSRIVISTPVTGRSATVTGAERPGACSPSLAMSV